MLLQQPPLPINCGDIQKSGELRYYSRTLLSRGCLRRRVSRLSSSNCVVCSCQQYETLAVIGGGPAGIFGAIRAKSICPSLDVILLEQNRFLSKVKISGGGRCNVTTGLYDDPLDLAIQYPRGHKELKGSFFRMHGPKDTAKWFEERGVSLKIEEDGRMFPVSDTSMTIVECLLDEAHKVGVVLQEKIPVRNISLKSKSLYNIVIGEEKLSRSILDANYLLIATGSSRVITWQNNLATQLLIHVQVSSLLK